jgi:hypothetical protein
MTRRPALEAMLSAMSVLASSYPFADVMWTMVVFFAWVIFVYLLILILADNFSRHDLSGLAKAGWTLFVIFVPLVGILTYMIVRPREPAGAP